MASIDLNSDLGEGAGTEADLMPLISSANIACGAHAGDPATMRATIALAMALGVRVGAHPGYRDPEHFGRRALDLPGDLLRADLAGQIGELRAFAEAAGTRLTHVKAHGALYNQGERDERMAELIASAVAAIDPALEVVASPGSAMARAAARAGLPLIREGFIDRAYEPDGTLRSRALPGAMVLGPAAAAAQALGFVRDGGVRATDGSFLPLTVDTLCLHGDSAGATRIARAVRAAFEAAGIAVRAPA
ncbi:MAG TPA: 5-oxoprolinase subunit PxpA [Candidatus Saccharimonadales bacterium]|nr:5-oxoprolinase subunit PxpA [Candidatus Saccharimonadales bacterium]